VQITDSDDVVAAFVSTVTLPPTVALSVQTACYSYSFSDLLGILIRQMYSPHSGPRTLAFDLQHWTDDGGWWRHSWVGIWVGLYDSPSIMEDDGSGGYPRLCLVSCPSAAGLAHDLNELALCVRSQLGQLESLYAKCTVHWTRRPKARGLETAIGWANILKHTPRVKCITVYGHIAASAVLSALTANLSASEQVSEQCPALTQIVFAGADYTRSPSARRDVVRQLSAYLLAREAVEMKFDSKYLSIQFTVNSEWGTESKRRYNTQWMEPLRVHGHLVYLVDARTIDGKDPDERCT